MLDVISPEEEARLAALGCHVLLEPGDDAALIFDIGGGSTELVLIDTSEPVPRVLDWHSTPWGVVSLTEHIGEADSARARRAAYARMREIVAESLAPFAARLPGGLRHPRLLRNGGPGTHLAESDERRVGEGGVSPGQSPGSPLCLQKK